MSEIKGWISGEKERAFALWLTQNLPSAREVEQAMKLLIAMREEVAHCPDTGKGAGFMEWYAHSGFPPTAGPIPIRDVVVLAEAYAAQSGSTPEGFLIECRLCPKCGRNLMFELCGSCHRPRVLHGIKRQLPTQFTPSGEFVCLICDAPKTVAAENPSPESRKTERITAEARYRKELPDTTNREASIYRDGFHDGWDANAAHSSRKLPVPPQPKEFSRSSPIAEPKATPEISQQEAQRLADDFGVPVSFDEEISQQKCPTYPSTDPAIQKQHVWPQPNPVARRACHEPTCFNDYPCADHGESIPSVAPAKEKI